MKLLLDSHCLIWLLADAPQLTSHARTIINDAESVWFSDASIWELGLKWRKGKIAVEPRRIADHALHNGLRPLPIHLEAFTTSCELQQEHADPFDRLLYAQAKMGGYQLLMADAELVRFGAVALLAATPR